MINPSAFEMFMTPEQKEGLRALKELGKSIKAQITIHSDGVEIKLLAGNAAVSQCLPQIGENLTTSIAYLLHNLFGITGEINRLR